MYLFRVLTVDDSWCPFIIIPSSLNFLAMSRADSFEIYNQNLL
jgi:hypothetical protein